MALRARRVAPAKGPPRSIRAGRRFATLPDIPDIRDRFYEPTLLPLPDVMPSPSGLAILDQGREGACTGFALAAVINLLLRRRAPNPASVTRLVSPHMLYANALRHDEWPGETYEGSSLRGALRGLYNCGACQVDLWPQPNPDRVSIEAAKDAHQTALGAYYRLRPHLPDYHAAISETGAIYVSAAVHRGWDRPPAGRIVPGAGAALHAFAVVGYDAEGFWVQNSWGPDWGAGGLAHWSYQDWAANIGDAWVLQLAVPSPGAFGLGVKRGGDAGGAGPSGSGLAPPTRNLIEGHFAHLRNGDFATTGTYWSNEADVRATAERLGARRAFRHVLLYAHGGLNTPKAAAIRTSAMKQVFLDNGIYPYSVLYDTGLAETLRDVVLGRGREVTERTGGLLDVTDRLIEMALSGIGTGLWNEMKRDADLPFRPGRDGERALRHFAAALTPQPGGPDDPIAIHLVGHSTGAVLLGHLLAALDRIVPGGMQVASCSLLAPACTVDFYTTMYRPRLGPGATTPARIAAMKVYNLSDTAEQADSVTALYNKSLLYLVSNAFEAQPGMPLLGMQKFSKNLKADPVTFQYAKTAGAPSDSTTHGGFDNDPKTMNDILRTVLGQEPKRAFTTRDLEY